MKIEKRKKKKTFDKRKKFDQKIEISLLKLKYNNNDFINNAELLLYPYVR